MYICQFFLEGKENGLENGLEKPSLEEKCIPCVETSSLASAVLNLIISNFLFKPFKITPGHKKTANPQLVIQVEHSMVSIQGALTDSRGQDNDDGFPLNQAKLPSVFKVCDIFLGTSL